MLKLYVKYPIVNGGGVENAEIINGVLDLEVGNFYVNMEDNTTIKLPNVKEHTEIKLWFKANADLNINFSNDIMWQSEPEATAGRTYEYVFSCVNGVWFGRYVGYLTNKPLIAKYTFNTDTDTLPTFNDGFEYEIKDKVDEVDGTTTREIRSDMTPIKISFEGKTGLISVYYLNTSNVTNMSRMFYGCKSLISLDLSNFDTSKATDMSYMFYNCSALTSLDLSNFDTGKVTNISNMFYKCSNLTSIDLSNFNTVNVTNMSGMFGYCSNLTSIDLSNFNTSKTTSMSAMFKYCSNLTSIDLSNFDTGKVTNIGNMFYECSNLTSIDLSNFDTSKVTDMSAMFEYCSNLTSIDLSNFNTNNVTHVKAMFYGCSSLISLDLSNFDTNKMRYYEYMFRECSSLEELDLSSFVIIDNVYSVTGMLQEVPKTCVVKVSDGFTKTERDCGWSSGQFTRV